MSGPASDGVTSLFSRRRQRADMSQDTLSECPFCDFEPDVPHEDVKNAPEQATHRVHQHVEEKHPDQTDELDSYTSPG
jgi:hypothetical protein